MKQKKSSRFLAMDTDAVSLVLFPRPSETRMNLKTSLKSHC